MPRRVSPSGLLTGLLLLYSATASGFALFDETGVADREIPMPAPLDELGKDLRAFGMPTYPRLSVDIQARRDVLPDLYQPAATATENPLLTPDQLWPEGLTFTEPPLTDALEAPGPSTRTVLPVPPTVALLGLGSMLVLGFIRQGIAS